MGNRPISKLVDLRVSGLGRERNQPRYRCVSSVAQAPRKHLDSRFGKLPILAGISLTRPCHPFRVAYINGSSYPNRPNQFFPAYLHHLGQVAQPYIRTSLFPTADEVQGRGTDMLTGGGPRAALLESGYKTSISMTARM